MHNCESAYSRSTNRGTKFSPFYVIVYVTNNPQVHSARNKINEIERIYFMVLILSC
jgi:hypothetical protein